MERRSITGNPGFVAITRVVEGRIARHPESHVSAHQFDAAHHCRLPGAVISLPMGM
jgi:hypothetical protein